MHILAKNLSGKNNVSRRVTGHTIPASVHWCSAIAQGASLSSTLTDTLLPQYA